VSKIAKANLAIILNLSNFKNISEFGLVLG